MIKALFFDIDGTLVSFNTRKIPSSVLSTIAEAKTEGIKISIATGRPKAIINSPSVLQKQSLMDDYITMNGGYCFVGDEVTYKHSIPAEDVKTPIALSNEKGFPCIFVAEHTAAVCNSNELVSRIFHEFLHVDILPVQTTTEATQTEIFQITPLITTEDEKNMSPLLPHCESGCWLPTFINVVTKGIHKQRGIGKVIRHFSIRLEEAMVFGNGGSNISMPRHAAVGVAVGNVNDEVKEATDYTTVSVGEDGIQEALKHFGVI